MDITSLFVTKFKVFRWPDMMILRMLTNKGRVGGKNLFPGSGTSFRAFIVDFVFNFFLYFLGLLLFFCTFAANIVYFIFKICNL